MTTPKTEIDVIKEALEKRRDDFDVDRYECRRSVMCHGCCGPAARNAADASADSLISLVVSLLEKLELASDLLMVPERNQDDDWYNKEKLIHSAVDDLKKELGVE